MSLPVEVGQRGEFGVELREEAAEVNEPRRHAGHGLGFARPRLALEIGDEGRLKGGMDVNDAIRECLGLLPGRRRCVEDAQMEQHPVGAAQGGSVVTPPLARLETTASTSSGQRIEVVEGQPLEAHVGLDEQTTDGLGGSAQALGGGEPDRFATLAETLHVGGQWTGDDLSPKARELARDQVVVAGLEPAVDHQEDQERRRR